MKQLLEKYRALTRGRQVAIAVLAAHCLALIALLIHHCATYKPFPKHPIIVRTASPKLSVAAPSTKTTHSAISSNPKKKQSAKPVAKKETKPAAKKKSSSIGVTGTKKELNEIAEAFDSLATKTELKSDLLPIPATIDRVVGVADEGLSSGSYSELVVAALQSSLDLPEYGEVKLRLKIDRLGTPISCEIVEAKSEKNGEFLKNRLPELAFPCFNDFGILENSLEFTITFRNVENR